VVFQWNTLAVVFQWIFRETKRVYGVNASACLPGVVSFQTFLPLPSFLFLLLLLLLSYFLSIWKDNMPESSYHPAVMTQ